MTALQRLQEKIEQWRSEHEVLKHENTQLKAQLNNTSHSQDKIESLEQELKEKDIEIEKIIAQVETLLDEI